MKKLRMTHAAHLVLEDLKKSAGWRYGYQISQSTGLRTGTVSAVLRRLNQHGITETHIEDINPTTEHRPRRVYHRIKGNQTCPPYKTRSQ